MDRLTVRNWGDVWLGTELWDRLGLDGFWRSRLPPSRKGTDVAKQVADQFCHNVMLTLNICEMIEEEYVSRNKVIYTLKNAV